MEERVYECKTEFELPKWDDDNDCFLEETIKVEKGSVWSVMGSGYICDGEVRLENDNAEWMEISREHLKEYFVDITKDNSEMANDEYLRSGY